MKSSLGIKKIKGLCSRVGILKSTIGDYYFQSCSISGLVIYILSCYLYLYKCACCNPCKTEREERQTQTDRQTDREVHLKSSSCEAIFPIGSHLGILNKNLKTNKIEKWSKVLKLYFSPAFA